MEKKLPLADAAFRIEGQPMFKVLDKVHELERQGEHVIHFEIGDPDFKTPNNIIEAATQALHEGKTHYTSSMGLYELREAAAKATERSRGFLPDIDQVLITPGANIIIYLVIKCVANPGDEIIFPDPGFPTYYSAIKFCETVPVRVPLREENDFRMSPDDVRKAITPKTKLIIINSPNNPTGAVMTKEEMNEIYKIAKEHNIYLLTDEIYSRMIYHDHEFYSPTVNDACKETCIVLNGFSKAFAMTGWRLGIAIGPKDVIEKMGLLVQTLCSCVPPFIQWAGVTAINDKQDEIKKMMDTYKERRDIIVDGLNSLPGVTCVKSEGAFYVLPNVSGTGMSGDEFVDLMLEKARCALLPGNNFGEYGEDYVRLSYATNKENIQEGIERMRKVLEEREQEKGK